MKDKIQRITRAMNKLRGSRIHGATKTEKANLGRCEDPDYRGSFAQKIISLISHTKRIR